MKQIAQGRRGQIFLENIDGKLIATKKAIDETKKSAINKESILISKLNSLGIDFVPKIIEKGDGFFKYYYIDGVHFDKYFKKLSSDLDKYKIIKQLVDCAFLLDKNGIVHGELNNPFSNVLITCTGKIAIIDFDRGKFTKEVGKNLRAVGQRLNLNNYISIQQLKDLGRLNDLDNIYSIICNSINNKLNKNKLTRGIVGFISILFLFDQRTKIFFYNYHYFSDIFFITPILNEGISWGIKIYMPFIIIISVFALLFFVWLFSNKHLNSIEFSFLIGGLLGNFFDRIFIGGVRDFIDFYYWPVFNFADIFLSLALLIIVYNSLIKNKLKS